MLALLSWLAVGAVVGVTVRALAPDQQHLGATRAIVLGVSGGLTGGLLGTALLGSGDPSGTRPLAVCLAAAVGAGMIPWVYLAYGVRWTQSRSAAAGHSPADHG